MGQESG